MNRQGNSRGVTIDGIKYINLLILVGGEMQGEECGGNSDQIITWGGPLAIFR